MTSFDYQAAALERKRNDKMLRDAAPDLLAALIELDAWVINESGAVYPEGTFEIVRAAIVKGN